MKSNKPAVVVEYVDNVEDFKGWLVIDGIDHPLCAGGMRVQKGLCAEHLKEMARNMARKMRLCGLPISGAECGIDYDPDSPGKRAAMTRFINAIKPFMLTRYSMGPDLNTKVDELTRVANSCGIPSIKYAIGAVQNFESNYFQVAMLLCQTHIF